MEIRDRRTLYGLLVNSDVAFGDAISADRIRVHGDLVTFLETIYRSTDEAISLDSRKHRFKAWLNRPRRNTRAGSRSNIHHHYDLGNDFYRLWLDEEMVYTCAYYPHENATLEEAQQSKMDHVCRKLELRPGQRVVEAGCGWGSLAIHMARRYGAQVRAFNISREQIRFARERAAALGLGERVEFVEDDYRTVEGEYDAFVSVAACWSTWGWTTTARSGRWPPVPSSRTAGASSTPSDAMPRPPTTPGSSGASSREAIRRASRR